MARARAQGHNLLEVVVASFIFVVASLALTGVFALHKQALTQSREYLVGSNLGQRVMEECIAGGYAGAPDVAGHYADPIIMDSKYNGVEVKTVYQVSIGVTDVAPPTGPMRQVVVRVDWQEGAVAREVRYETLLSDS